MLRRCYVFTGNQDCQQSSEHCRCTEKHVPKESCKLALQIAMKQRNKLPWLNWWKNGIGGDGKPGGLPVYMYIYVYILAHVFGPSQTSPRFDGGLPLLLALWDYFLHLHLSLLCGVAKYEGIESVSQWSLDHLAPSRHLCGSDRSDSTTRNLWDCLELIQHVALYSLVQVLRHRQSMAAKFGPSLHQPDHHQHVGHSAGRTLRQHPSGDCLPRQASPWPCTEGLAKNGTCGGLWLKSHGGKSWNKKTFNRTHTNICMYICLYLHTYIHAIFTHLYIYILF